MPQKKFALVFDKSGRAFATCKTDDEGCLTEFLREHAGFDVRYVDGDEMVAEMSKD